MSNNTLTPKRLLRKLRNAPLILVTTAVALAIEAFAAGGIFQENMATVTIAGLTVSLAYAEMIMSVSCSLGSLVLSAASAEQKADSRPEQNKRAAATQLLAIALLTAPVYYAGNELGRSVQVAAAHSYAGSSAEAADRAIAMDPQADSRERANAAESLKQAIVPAHAKFDLASTAWIAFLLGCNMSAMRLGYRVRPETPAEAKARLMKERVAKARKTRERNKREDDDTNVVHVGRKST
jgi:hypothetical protein